ncbi:hypothetical protein PtB15_2B166 [Puccinia triticina]|nr:hypothetical protein PtB15_2B166 [Puccinia triticina]
MSARNSTPKFRRWQASERARWRDLREMDRVESESSRGGDAVTPPLGGVTSGITGSPMIPSWLARDRFDISPEPGRWAGRWVQNYAEASTAVSLRPSAEPPVGLFHLAGRTAFLPAANEEAGRRKRPSGGAGSHLDPRRRPPRARDTPSCSGGGSGPFARAPARRLRASSKRRREIRAGPSSCSFAAGSSRRACAHTSSSPKSSPFSSLLHGSQSPAVHPGRSSR